MTRQNKSVKSDEINGEKISGIVTSSDQLFDEQFDCEWDIMTNAEKFIDKFCATMQYDNVKLNKEDEEMAKMLKVAFERRWNLIGAREIIEEFENTIPKSKNFKKISAKNDGKTQ